MKNKHFEKRIKIKGYDILIFAVTYSKSIFYREANGLDAVTECLLAPCLSPPALSDGRTARRFDISQQDTERAAIKCKYRTLWMTSYAHDALSQLL